jgi:murein L,D-transpeptidase YcbB/YkuD
VLPQLRKDLAVADREGYELVRGQRDDSPVVPLTPASLDALEHGELRIRQRAGAKNALGAVKFMLPNPYNVYLHSTPAQRLFGQSLRAFSHGCIRVEDPVALAQFVFADDPSWTRERLVEAMQDEAPLLRVNLKKTIPVVVFYATAIAAEDGRVLFFEDLYRHDRRLDALLGGSHPAR